MRVGDYVSYNGHTFLLWKIEDHGRVRLLDKDGDKYHELPRCEDVAYVSSLPVIQYNKYNYIVTHDNVIYSTSTGKRVYDAVDNSTNVQRKNILDRRDNNVLVTSNAFSPNEEQAQALKGMAKFLKSKEQFFILSGRGGTGKTTIIRKLTENLNPLFVAPTHKAKAILERSVGRKAMTLASAMFIDFDESTGKYKPNLSKRSNKKFKMPIKTKKLIVIDEASMISDNLLIEFHKIITQECPYTKVIFMGDNAQLPPVGQDRDSNVFKIKNSFNLKRIMRQDIDSPIIPLAKVVADNVESEKPVTRVIENRKNDYNQETNEGVKFCNCQAEFLDEFILDFQQHPSSTRLITFNNESNNAPQSVKSLNAKVRKMLYGDNVDDFVVGDQLMLYNTLMEDDKVILENSLDFTIVSVNGSSFPQEKTIEAFSRKNGLRKTKIRYNAISIKLKDNSNGGLFSGTIPTISSRESINQQIQKLFNVDKDPQLGYVALSAFPRFEYAYAITSHKAQGSTYRNSYVLEDNILNGTKRKSKQKNQSLYVALSRASHKLVIQSRCNPDDTK